MGIKKRLEYDLLFTRVEKEPLQQNLSRDVSVCKNVQVHIRFLM